MALKAITIDFWNTMFDSSNGTGRNQYRQSVLHEEIEKLNVNVDDLNYQEALKASWEYFNNIWKNEVRTPQTLETVEFFWNYLKLPYSTDAIDKVATAFAECLLYHPPDVLPGVKEGLEKLSAKYPLAIISDTGFSPGTVLRQLLKDKGMLHYFSAFSFSDETGVSKPHPKAYWTVLEKMGCEPAETLHIGDIEATDIAGAKRLGMKAIRFSGDAGVVNRDNTERTLADIELASWNEIVSYIFSLEKRENHT